MQTETPNPHEPAAGHATSKLVPEPGSPDGETAPDACAKALAIVEEIDRLDPHRPPQVPDPGAKRGAASSIEADSLFLNDRGPCAQPGAATDRWDAAPIGRFEIASAVLAGCLALLLRLPFIVNGHTMLHSDECVVGLMAQSIQQGERFPLFFYGQRYMGALEAYVIAAITPFTNDPIVALRLGPALFLVGLTAVLFLMGSRWFGRRGGWVAALAMIFCSPMVMQWTIAARGGYVEVMLVGALLWWAYGEWFVIGSPTSTHKFLLGGLVGFGMWINPMIAAFTAPVIVHFLLGKPLAGLRSTVSCLENLDRFSSRFPILLPVVAALLVAAASCLAHVRIAESEVEYRILYGLLPKRLGSLIVGGTLLAAGGYIATRKPVVSWLRGSARAHSSFIFGLLAGNSPSILYVTLRTIQRQPLEGSLPLGLRSITDVGQTAYFALRGLPHLFGPDPRHYMNHVLVGRDYLVNPMPPTVSFTVGVLGVVALLAALALVGLLIASTRERLADCFRMLPRHHSPIVFVVLAIAGFSSLYIVSGCSFDFTSIRYLVPLGAVIPLALAGLVAVRRDRLTVVLTAVLLTTWATGQAAMLLMIGPAHPLESVASRLEKISAEPIIAEPLDAHVVSFLTAQSPRVSEFQPFWSRLAHFRSEIWADQPVSYLVDVSGRDWTKQWNDPGKPPIETRRFLLPALQQWLAVHPRDLLRRQPLGSGYELWTLARPIPEKQFRAAADPDALSILTVAIADSTSSLAGRSTRRRRFRKSSGPTEARLPWVWQ